MPPIKVPKAEVTVKMPEFKMPKIPPVKVPTPKVTVNVPEQKAPVVNVTERDVTFPDSMDVGLDRFTLNTPMPVMSVDPKGNFVSPSVGAGGGRSLPRKERVGAPKLSSFVLINNNTTTILEENLERHTFTIVNDGDETVYITYGKKAVVNSGIRLNPLGGSHTDDIYTGPVSGCTGTVTNNITLLEL